MSIFTKKKGDTPITRSGLSRDPPDSERALQKATVPPRALQLVRQGLSIIADQTKQPQNAVRYFERALTIRPDCPEALVELAEFLRLKPSEADHMRAVDHCERAFYLGPGHPRSLEVLAHSLDTIGAFEASALAAELAATAYSLRKDQTGTRESLVHANRSYTKIGDPRGDLYASRVSSLPSNLSALEECSGLVKDKNANKTQATKLWRYDPACPHAVLLLGAAYDQRDEIFRASLREAMRKKDSKSVPAFYNDLGNVLHRFGFIEEALDALELCILWGAAKNQIDQTNEAVTTLSTHYDRQGHPVIAQDLIKAGGDAEALPKLICGSTKPNDYLNDLRRGVLLNPPPKESK